MSPSQSLKVAQMNLFFVALFYALAVGSAKLAVLALYWRMFSLGRLRYPIIVLATCSVLWILIRVRVSISTLLFQPKAMLSNRPLVLGYARGCPLHTSVQVLGPISAWTMPYRRWKIVPRRSVQSSHARHLDHCASLIRTEETSTKSMSQVRCDDLILVWIHVRSPTPSYVTMCNPLKNSPEPAWGHVLSLLALYVSIKNLTIYRTIFEVCSFGPTSRSILVSFQVSASLL